MADYYLPFALFVRMLCDTVENIMQKNIDFAKNNVSKNICILHILKKNFYLIIYFFN